MFKKNPFLLLLVLSTAFLIYSPSLKNDFIWDDLHLVVNDEGIKDVRNLPGLFKSHLFNSTCGSNFYRPLQAASYMFDYSIWRLNPFGYHLTNIILHLLNVILVFYLVGHAFKNPAIGLLTALIFAIHPVNTEAIAYIAGRADPLSCFFFLSAFLLYIRFREGRRSTGLFFLSLFFFVCSLLTKEAMLIFPLVLILYDVFILGHNSVEKRSLVLYGPYLLALILYAAFRFFIMGFPSQLLGRIPFNIYLFTMPKVFILYLWLLFFPVALHMERVEPIIESIFEPQAVFFLSAVICLAWVSMLIYRRSKALFFFISFFIVTLLPMLNILPINAMLAEHWLYLPSIGVYSVVSFGVVKLLNLKGPSLSPLGRGNKMLLPLPLGEPTQLLPLPFGERVGPALSEAEGVRGKLAVFILLAFLCFFLVRTTLRNIEWGEPVRFYKNLLRHNPHSVRGHSNLGMVYLAVNDYRSARQEFQTAVAIDPGNSFCHYGLGLLDYLEGDIEGAVGFWKNALSIAPFYKTVRKSMSAALYRRDKRFRRLLRAVSERPSNIMAHFRLSTLYLNNGLYIEALDRLEQLLEVDPDYTDAIFNRAWVYSKLGIYREAIQEYERLKALTPDDPDLYRNMGFCYAALNKHKEAEAMWQKADALQNQPPLF